MDTPAARHWAHWPPDLPHHLTLPQTHLFHLIEVSAARYPDKPCTLFYDSPLSYAEFRREAERLAGWLQQVAGVQRGDRVLIALQNSPQWALAFYAVLRADAVAVPLNPMNRTEELRHCMADSGARVAFIAQDLVAQFQPLLLAPDQPGPGLRQVVVATYSDHLRRPTDLPVPDAIAAPRFAFDHPAAIPWREAVAADLAPSPLRAGPDDLAAMPYTSGTTGRPKGCMHTHRSVMSTLVGGAVWFGRTQDTVALAGMPFFHVTGLAAMNGALYLGATLVPLPRWDRDATAAIIQRHRVQVWQAISTMMIDFLANPELGRYDLSSLQSVRGGGAAMPAAVAARLKALTGLDYVEGYGMSETFGATHINPRHRPKPQCLGIPVFDVDAQRIDPQSGELLSDADRARPGEIVIHAPQVMQGYWQQPQATEEAFITLGGRRYLRTGDLAVVDDDGYFFMVDRLKRMINAAGYKVWPAEVEALLHGHPAILEACIIGTRDPRRGETVKAVVVLKAGHTATEQQVIEWAQGRMAAYKCPRVVQFVPTLPKSGAGKVAWRQLQEAENKE